MKKNSKPGESSTKSFPWSAKEFCLILDSCAKNKVIDLELEGISIKFGIAPDVLATTLQYDPDRITPTVEEIKKVEQAAVLSSDAEIKTEYLEHLMIEDPLEYQRTIEKELNDNGQDES